MKSFSDDRQNRIASWLLAVLVVVASTAVQLHETEHAGELPHDHQSQLSDHSHGELHAHGELHGHGDLHSTHSGHGHPEQFDHDGHWHNSHLPAAFTASDGDDNHAHDSHGPHAHHTVATEHEHGHQHGSAGHESGVEGHEDCLQYHVFSVFALASFDSSILIETGESVLVDHNLWQRSGYHYSPQSRAPPTV